MQCVMYDSKMAQSQLLLFSLCLFLVCSDATSASIHICNVKRGIFALVKSMDEWYCMYSAKITNIYVDREKEWSIMLFLKSFPWISFAGLSEPPRKNP